MPRVIHVTLADGNNWKLPFNFALGLHIALIIGTIYMPDLLNNKPLYPKIYTIDLVNVQIPSPPQSTPAPKSKEIIDEKKAVSVSPPTPAEEVVKPIKPVSIKPLKRKKKIKNPEPDLTRQKKLKELHQKRLQEAKEAERRAQEAATLAAEQAVEQLKNMLRETKLQDDSSSNRRPSTQNVKQQRPSNILENQYFASIFNTLQPHWKLPEYRMWAPDLVATVVIRVSKSGNIADYFFEKKSGDRLFDQFVVKTIQEGNPLPPIPSAMKKNSLEVGLHFKPGTIIY